MAPDALSFIEPVKAMANLYGVTFVRKGPVDIVTDGRECLLVTTPGSLKRTGGIGDILAGTMATFV